MPEEGPFRGGKPRGGAGGRCFSLFLEGLRDSELEKSAVIGCRDAGAGREKATWQKKGRTRSESVSEDLEFRTETNRLNH